MRPDTCDSVGAELRTRTAAEKMCPNVNIACKISAAPAGPTDTKCGITHSKRRNQRGNFYVCRHEQKPYCCSPEPLLSSRSPEGTAQEKCTFSLCLTVCVSPVDALPSPNLKAPKDHQATGVTDGLHPPCQESLHWNMKVLRAPCGPAEGVTGLSKEGDETEGHPSHQNASV